MTLDLMSSEDSCSEDANSSDEEASEVRRGLSVKTSKLIRRPLPWRSTEATNYLMSLDRKCSRRQSEQAKRMMAQRADGTPSNRGKQDNVPEWAVDDFCG